MRGDIGFGTYRLQPSLTEPACVILYMDAHNTQFVLAQQKLVVMRVMRELMNVTIEMKNGNFAAEYLLHKYRDRYRFERDILIDVYKSSGITIPDTFDTTYPKV